MNNKATAAEVVSNNPLIEDIDDVLAFMLKMANKRLQANLEEIQVIKNVQAKTAANKNSSN